MVTRRFDVARKTASLYTVVHVQQGGFQRTAVWADKAVVES